MNNIGMRKTKRVKCIKKQSVHLRFQTFASLVLLVRFSLTAFSRAHKRVPLANCAPASELTHNTHGYRGVAIAPNASIALCTPRMGICRGPDMAFALPSACRPSADE